MVGSCCMKLVMVGYGLKKLLVVCWLNNVKGSRGVTVIVGGEISWKEVLVIDCNWWEIIGMVSKLLLSGLEEVPILYWNAV